MTNETDISKLSIEESFERLEEILSRMEAEDTGLEQSFQLYEQGLKLIRQTEAGIGQVEKKIKILKDEQENG